MPINSYNKDTTFCKLEVLKGRLAGLTEAAGPEVLADWLADWDLNINTLSNWVNFDPDLYSRNRVIRYEFADLLVMCWKYGQLSPIHDHQGSACAIKVLQGVATEISYSSNDCGIILPNETNQFSNGVVFYSNDLDVHQMGNLNQGEPELVTLHCYSPPLATVNIFDESKTFFAGYQALCDASTRRLGSSASAGS